jgi:hypothetical protein
MYVEDTMNNYNVEDEVVGDYFKSPSSQIYLQLQQTSIRCTVKIPWTII